MCVLRHTHSENNSDIHASIDLVRGSFAYTFFSCTHCHCHWRPQRHRQLTVIHNFCDYLLCGCYRLSSYICFVLELVEWWLTEKWMSRVREAGKLCVENQNTEKNTEKKKEIVQEFATWKEKKYICDSISFHFIPFQNMYYPLRSAWCAFPLALSLSDTSTVLYIVYKYLIALLMDNSNNVNIVIFVIATASTATTILNCVLVLTSSS